MRSPPTSSATSTNTESVRPRPPSSRSSRRCRRNAVRSGKESWLTTSPKASLSADYFRTEISRWQARSMTISTRGIVSAESPLAAQAGAVVLARGGHAAEAAIAANAVMGVVAPMMNGVGGDLFAIVHDAASGAVHGLNASGWSPAGMSIEFLSARGMKAMPQAGIHSVTVPGAVAGWMALHGKFGRMPLETILSAAIAHAEEGYPVSEIMSLEWAGSVAALQTNRNATATYLPDGRAPAAGDLFRKPALARTLRAIARDGADAVYRGDVAKLILNCSVEQGGAFDASDLAEYEAEWVSPLTTNYRGWEVYEMPPNSQGIAALVMLNILENFPLGEYGCGTADTLHLMIEAKKLAFADMQRHIGDPRFSKMPVEAMLSKAYARQRAALIDPRHAKASVDAGQLPTHGGDTTYLCAVDASGNICSLIQSNFANFGSAVVPDGAGFVLQSRGGLFTFDRSHPNALAPRKRPLQTVIPAFMKRDQMSIGFGVMGGWNQPQAHVQVISNVVDHGLNIQQALEAPRFVKLTFPGTDVIVESRVPEGVRQALERRGHDIDLQSDFSNMVGGGQAVIHDARAKVNYGGSDPRKDGAAIPEPIL
ncbi:MAG: gamma-glutamyltransferase [Acidobacteria bacterium]|nr:MAG: gamma-glutamyltransferase [Acidobacteriota bacterium]